MHQFSLLHMHDSFSQLDGISDTDGMVKRAKELGCRYIAQTNHGNVAGHLDLLIAAKKYDIHPICGMEAYHWVPEYHVNRKRAFHLLLNAVNTEGLHNLWQISSDIYRDTGDKHRKPYGEWKHFEGHGKGILCSSACLAGALSQFAAQDDEKSALEYANRYSEIFDGFYIELHTNQLQKQLPVNRWLEEFAEKYNFKTIYATDSHFIMPEDSSTHEAWLGLRTHHTFMERNDPDAFHTIPDEYIPDEQDVRKRLSYLGDKAIERAFDGVDDYVSHVEPYDIDSSRKIPHSKLVPAGMDSGDYLKRECAKGLCTKVLGMNPMGEKDGKFVFEKGSENGVDPQPYIDRLFNEEYPIIIDHGLADFFLITMDYMRAAKKMMLCGPARGSAGGSLVCYLLDITEIDPVKRNLMFGRFLNIGRVDSMPDIDVDMARDSRSKAEDYLVDTYGSDHVAKVGTVLCLKMKAAVDKAGWYYNVPFDERKRITKLIDMIPDMIQKEEKDWTWLDIWRSAPKAFHEQIKYYVDNYPSMFDLASKIYKLTIGLGEHAAGYIVSPTPLASILPTWRNPKNEKLVMQFNMRAVDKYGFLKIDVLGLRTLQTLQEANEFLVAHGEETVDFYSLDDGNENDMQVWDMLCAGDTMGVFQLEAQTVIEICRSLQPRCVEDLSAIVALDRPGVLDAGMLQVYLKRRNGEPFEYDFPECEPVLKSTYGIILYQEISMELCKVLAGYDDVEADHMRKIIGHKKLKEMDAEEDKFISGCISRGFDEDKSRNIFSQIKASGNYSFNRSHSYAYGLIAYWCAYMKVHHELEYMTACLNTDDKKNNKGEDPTLKYIARCHTDGIEILPPDVNQSGMKYTICDGSHIRMGFASIAGIGDKAAKDILAGQPYSSFEDFMYRKVAPKDVSTVLAQSGAFSCFGGNRSDYAKRIEDGDYPLPDGVPDTQMTFLPFNPDEYQRRTEVLHEYTDDGIIMLESQLFGMPVSLDPYIHYRAKLGEMYNNIEHVSDLENAPFNSTHVVLGRLVKHKEIETRKGKRMAFATIQCDDYIAFEATVFSELFCKKESSFSDGGYIMAEISKQKYNSNVSYVMNDIRLL